MISLLYHSHTVVPAHLSELEGLGFLEPDEQILVALDGVLLDKQGRRLSGPTLHDYCLVTSLRIILWGRDYGNHLCYAFPLTELVGVEGAGVDPIHAQIQLAFAAPDEPPEQFTLTLLPAVHVQAALLLLRSAAEAAQQLAEAGVDAREAGPEIMAVLGEQIYGHVDGPRPGETPYRWPGATAAAPVSAAPAFQYDPASLPPGQVYAAGRLARSAWDTLRRTLREAELPFELNSGSLRELTEAVRAINELVHTVASNPSAQQMAMAFLNRNNNGAAPEAPRRAEPQAQPRPEAAPAEPAAPPSESSYHEIPLRRRGQPAPAEPEPRAQDTAGQAAPANHREIPLRRRSPARPPLAVMSGSGDADDEAGGRKPGQGGKGTG